MIEELLQYKHADLVRRPNYIKIPVTALDINDTNMNIFNDIYMWIREKGWAKITRTKSGGISTDKKYFRPPMWDIRKNNACIELTIIIGEGMWRVQFRNQPKIGGESISGTQAFRKFRDICKNFGIDLNDYVINDGAKEKNKIEKYMVECPNERYMNSDIKRAPVFENVHHIDFHSSFMAGLANTHKEFYGPVNFCYEKRKLEPIYKAILTHTYGYFQSMSHGGKWAHLAKDCVKDNNDRVREIAQKIKESGGIVLLYNTDGLWYLGKEYHGAGEGKRLGEWENDHCAEKFRIKSKGAYEFIENGVVYSILRGYTNLDKIKPRRESGIGWEWGDIFLTHPNIYKFDENIGIYKENDLWE